MKIVAFIPARGGSKRIPRKNIKLFAGKPLIFWSIQQAQESKYINDIVVSTDDEEIRQLAIENGARAPFLRPAEISQDLSTDQEAIEHYIEFCKKNGNLPDLIVHLRPTYPNRKVEIIDEAIEKFIQLKSENYTSLRTVVETKPAFKMYFIKNDSESILIPYFQTYENVEEPFNKPAQILPKSYWHNGYLDLMWTSTVVEQKSITGSKIFPYVMNPEYVDDIDTVDEWKAAEKNHFSHNVM